MSTQAEQSDDTLITSIGQVGGGARMVYAQNAAHARRARELLRNDPAMIDHLNGVDGIRVSIREQ